MSRGPSSTVALAQLKLRLSLDQRARLEALAAHRRVSVNQLLRSMITHELVEADSVSGSVPDESAIREMAILLAVELGLKLQELTMPGGASRSRELLEAAARAAMERLEVVEASLQRVER